MAEIKPVVSIVILVVPGHDAVPQVEKDLEIFLVCLERPGLGQGGLDGGLGGPAVEDLDVRELPVVVLPVDLKLLSLEGLDKDLFPYAVETLSLKHLKF